MLQQKLSRASSSLKTSPHRSNTDVFLFPYEHKFKLFELGILFFFKAFFLLFVFLYS